VNLLIEYSGLEGTADLVTQIVLAEGREGEWPPNSYLIWPSKPKEESA
jgi:hypothetical protein